MVRPSCPEGPLVEHVSLEDAFRSIDRPGLNDSEVLRSARFVIEQ